MFWLGDLYSGLFTGKRDADINNIKLNKYLGHRCAVGLFVYKVLEV